MSIRKMHIYTGAYDYWYDNYQAYYLAGLIDELNKQRIDYNINYINSPQKLLSFIRKIRYSVKINKISMNIISNYLDKMFFKLKNDYNTPSGMFDGLTGQYIIELDNGSEKKICIDSRDGGWVGNETLLNWSDIYFKSNYHIINQYDNKVKPIINGNPRILNFIPDLINMRSTEKIYDVFCFIRVWEENREHVIKFIESISHINCSKYVCAYLVGNNLSDIKQRLKYANIAYTTKSMNLKKLWYLSSHSRINIIRLGVHKCVPWRMMDMLSMANCVALDKKPYTVWPTPLNSNTNYINLDISDTSEYQYDALPYIINHALSNSNYIKDIQNNNALYFDQHCSPNKVGEYILNTILDS